MTGRSDEQVELCGGSLVAGVFRNTGRAHFYALNPQDGERLPTAFCEAPTQWVAAAVEAAERAFDSYRKLPLAVRAEFLRAIGRQLEALETPLLSRAQVETGLPQERLQGELARTVAQLQQFAELVSDGSFPQAVVTSALPQRQPQPRPDLRRTEIPIGPVAVFGAANFPLAFSVAGGDTASALAAGCPVIVKGHPHHPGTCELAGRAVLAAQTECELPAGVFSLLQGEDLSLGGTLVQHPAIKAVAFTGSLAGGRALFDLAARRPEPIPLFAEMGSLNPLFLLPHALAEGGARLAQESAASILLGVGQFCTKPGLLFGLAGPELERFSEALADRLREAGAGVMLHAGLQQNYQAALGRLRGRAELLLDAEPKPPSGGCRVAPALLGTTGERFLGESAFSTEVFGPAALLVACDSVAQLLQCARQLSGQLTATVHAGGDEVALCRELFSILERKAGRLIYNGFPTGVEVCAAMVHGGPYPATSDSRFTSVGSEAIRRFLRPVCWQNVPPELLPAELSGL